MSSNALLEKMFSEINDSSLFEKSLAFGLQYIQEVVDRSVYPTEEAIDSLSGFEENMPEESGDSLEILKQLNRLGSPTTIPSVGGRYFGFVNGSMVPAGIAAKQLATFWDQNAALHIMSPISSKLAAVVEKWVVEALGLPKQTVAGFVSGTSMANFCGMAAARYRILKNQGWDIVKKGLFAAPQIRLVAGKQTHSSMIKAISMAGLGTDNIEWVDIDDQGRILANEIPNLDAQTILVLQAGNVNSGAFDDFKAICKKAKDQGAWIHIDGAFGLWAGATSSLNHLTTGYEYANSWAVDGHKTLNTPYDSGIVLCSDPEALVAALHSKGAYLIESEEKDGMNFTPEMSQRARVIDIWATLKFLGKKGINEMMLGFNQRAIQFAHLLKTSENFEVLNEVVFNQVIVQCATDELTEKVIHHIQALRECWVGESSWRGRKVIRISVCSWMTTSDDIQRSFDSFERAYKMIQG